MPHISPFLIVLFYAIAIASLLALHKQVKEKLTTVIFCLAFGVGLALHLIHAAELSYIDHSFNFSFASMLTWVSALIALTYAIGSLIYPIKNLAIIVLPLSAIWVLFAYAWGDQTQLIDKQSSVFYWHIATAVSAFTLLGLSVMQALLFGYQELALRKHAKSTFLSLLPPLQTMERVLFRCIVAGFILLSISITLGAIHNIELKQSIFSFNHHTVLAILSWIGFAILLYGRIKLGWRGMKVIIWTIVAFTFLKLGYFGTKVITEFLQR